ncbi:queuosine biosynthesis protein [Flexivirga endophytica]|uniref:Queuosine biosynthesis protein n=1 Tax=Flexivirga endophytica TaxID=1849103 RepID=A0A916THG4_9MICO|nr:S-adenosylmethionine:tRNA ribosyltransferase-isomerase [Flexivirga endophytica]GGB45421.1 queuosine biosynthesis protein [Flexivirga endophytica]GHB66569.1 queuosine biosynthesis protein [Flexivirga endophytica]
MTALAARPRTRFDAPDDRTAPAPAESRGVDRDGVRLLVASRDGVEHTVFRSLPDHLNAGDLVVVNNSATIAGQVDARRDGAPIVLHAATPLDEHPTKFSPASLLRHFAGTPHHSTWVVELRSAPDAARAVLDAQPGDHVEVGPLVLTLRAPYPFASSPTGVGNRLWQAEVDGDLVEHLWHHGRPISYGYLDRSYPLADYQTVFATVPGSAEMPSAARPFTPQVVTRLVAAGVGVAPITLHTGVSSQEAGEGPQAERFDVPEVTARQVNATRRAGGRIVAVGTTVARALESAVNCEGLVVGAAGWTERVITRDDPPRVVDGLITGWHDPHASHLLLVEAIAGEEMTQAAYDAAVRERYRWHEFGDSALLLP